MRYKGQFHGSKLLCPVSHCFVRLEEVKEKLERHECCLMEDEEEAWRLHTEKREHLMESLQGTPIVVVQDDLEVMQYDELEEVPKAKNTMVLYLDWWPSGSDVLFVVRGLCVCWCDTLVYGKCLV